MQALAAVTAEPIDAYKLVRTTVGEMRDKFPFLDWQTFFRAALIGSGVEGAGEIEVTPSFFSRLTLQLCHCILLRVPPCT